MAMAALQTARLSTASPTVPTAARMETLRVHPAFAMQQKPRTPASLQAFVATALWMEPTPVMMETRLRATAVMQYALSSN